MRTATELTLEDREIAARNMIGCGGAVDQMIGREYLDFLTMSWMRSALTLYERHRDRFYYFAP